MGVGRRGEGLTVGEASVPQPSLWPAAPYNSGPGTGLAQLPSLPSSPPAPAKSGSPQGFGGHPALEVQYGEPNTGKAQTKQDPRGKLLHRKLQDYICNDYSWALNISLSFPENSRKTSWNIY